MRTERARIILLALLLAAAVVVNLAQFATVNEGTNRLYKALPRPGTADLAELGYDSAGIRDRYGLHFALHELAPGANVLVSTASGKLDRERAARLYAFGRVARVTPVGPELAERVSAAESGFDPAPHVVASGAGGSRGDPWVIAAELPDGIRPDDPPDDPDDPDGRLATPWTPGAARALALPTRVPREFILLPWQDASAPEAAPVDLLLETSLLPEEIRKDLAH